MVALLAIGADISFPGTDLVEHGSGISEDIGIVLILVVVIDPILRGDIILIQADIVRQAGLVIGIVMFDYFKGVQVKVDQEQKKEGYGEEE